MASKSKRTASRQSNLQSRKRRKQGEKTGIPTVLKQISPIAGPSVVANKPQIESNVDEKPELSSDSPPDYKENISDNSQSDKITAASKPQVTTKRLKKTLYIAPELHIRAELTRIAAVTAIVVSMLVTFSFVV